MCSFQVWSSPNTHLVQLEQLSHTKGQSHKDQTRPTRCSLMVEINDTRHIIGQPVCNKVITILEHFVSVTKWVDFLFCAQWQATRLQVHSFYSLLGFCLEICKHFFRAWSWDNW